MTRTDAAPIVVGVDGSPAARSALRWAAGQATLVGAGLVAVTAWEFPLMYGLDARITYGDLEAAAGHMLSNAVRDALGAEPGVEVAERVVAGHPTQVLLEAARTAQLL